MESGAGGTSGFCMKKFRKSEGLRATRESPPLHSLIRDLIINKKIVIAEAVL